MTELPEKVARGNAARGEATRERLIAAALALFGRRGYEGVGAREIAEAAGTPLSAIPYHFGTKEALYRAVVARVCERLGEALAPAASAAGAVAAAPSGSAAATPEAARAALATLQGALLDVLAVRPEAEAWARVLVREHLDPGPAFDLVYDDAGRGVVELTAALVARATGRDAGDEAVLVEAFARVGEVLVFRTLQAAVTRRLGWPALGPAEAVRIRGALARVETARG